MPENDTIIGRKSQKSFQLSLSTTDEVVPNFIANISFVDI
jgi:hypothetical protein